MSAITRVRAPEAPAERATLFERLASRADLVPGVAVVLLALALNTWSLQVVGYGNTYYAAATRSMTQSWSNFFFGAFDPNGFITVDKPPIFLWVDAASARVFGYSTWSLVLPSAIAGAASVGLLWAIVRRYFGVFAATSAGLVLALTPVAVAVNRLNLPDPFFILALVAAAGAIVRSLDSRRPLAWLALAGVLVGIGFNIKMMAAWIPGPALALALVIAAERISWPEARTLALKLALLAGVTLAVSFSWILVVDAWPASARPYIGGSIDNNAMDLAFGYNGFARLNGDGGGPVPVQPGGQAPGAIAGPGGIFAGYAGPLRMLDNANGGQIGWLLPFALASAVIALWLCRRDRRKRAVVLLFAGWTLAYAIAFSYAVGTVHAYYTAAMAPGIAALTGIGLAALVEAARREARWLVALFAMVAATVVTQMVIAGRTPEFYGWLRPATIGCASAGLVLMAVLASRRVPVVAGAAVAIAGLLLLPAAWSLSAASNASLNATLPQAGPQEGFSGSTFGSLAFDRGTAGLAAWLEAHEDPGAEWQLVVPNAQVGARLIAQYGIPVMAVGGFLGRDDTLSLGQFAKLTDAGKVRYVLVTQATPLFESVLMACNPVIDSTLPPRYQYEMYDCAGSAAALRGEVPVAASTRRR